MVPTPSNPGGLDPSQHMSIATALGRAGYKTAMAGKWHLGINHKGQDRAFTPIAPSVRTSYFVNVSSTATTVILRPHSNERRAAVTNKC